jgi:1-deoxy-D-xylulose-5-phosphate synthase
MDHAHQQLLNDLKSPHQLRRMSHEQLGELAEAIRERVIEVVSANGGHLASNLGMAELTIAMHYVFDFSHDRLLWDVGHQCYPHKIITGRSQRFATLRQEGGLSGFPSPSESEYDLFATGHAGTAISTAAGLAWADQVRGEDRKAVAVVGDASIVNGLSLEGLNNASLLNRQFLIVLNDNSMAIDRTRGALAEALEHIRLTHRYSDLKAHTEKLLHHMPLGDELTETLKHIRDGLRTTLHGPKVFETLGFTYFGPVNGHDIPSLIRVLQRVRDMNYPVVLHVHTQKGRGCAYAVEDPCRFHSPSAYTIQDGQAVFADKHRPSWTQVFSESLIEQARADERVVALTAAMPDGTGLGTFREAFPDRTIDVGISESHAVAAAAGMAKSGLKPVVAIYSTFMQRAFDQVFHECCLQNLPVVFCMDRAGLVGSDGAVHHGFADIAFLRPLPGMTILAPADATEMAQALDFALQHDGPVAIRYPRDEVPEELPAPAEPFQLGRSRLVRDGKDATLLAYGTMVEPACAAADYLAGKHRLQAAVINARFAKPLDTTAIGRRIETGKPLLVLEDHARTGGFGSAVLELAADRGLDSSNVRLLGLPDRFVAHGSRQGQLREVGLDADTLAATVLQMHHNRTQHSARH